MSRPSVPFAILTHHRSGSNFLVDVVEGFGANCKNEPLAQHLGVFVQRDIEYWGSGGSLPSAARRELSTPFALTYLRDLKEWLTVVSPTAHGFKETRLIEKLEWFERDVSPVRPILLIRNPIAVTASILAQPHLVSYWISSNQLAHIASSGERMSHIHRRARHDLVARSAIIWKQRYRHALRLLAGREHLVVRHEDLIADPRRVGEQIRDYLQLPRGIDSESVIRRLWTTESAEGTYSTRRDPKVVTASWRSRLSEDEVADICDLTADTMAAFGYDTGLFMTSQSSRARPVSGIRSIEPSAIPNLTLRLSGHLDVARRLIHQALPIPGALVSRIRMIASPVTNADFIPFVNRLIDQGVDPRFVLNVTNPNLPLRLNGYVHCDSQKLGLPVVGVTWLGAASFAAWVGGRLPLVSEWESTASDGGDRTYPWGNTPPTADNANFDHRKHEPMPSEAFTPTGRGYMALAGNVREWCTSALTTQLDSSEQPVKGGGWSSPAGQLQIRATEWKLPLMGSSSCGFRVVFDSSMPQFEARLGRNSEGAEIALEEG